MKRIATTVVAMILALAAGASADVRYGWTLSSSNSDPDLHTGVSNPSAPFSIFLWLQCSPDSGMAAAQFSLSTPGGVTNFGFTPAGSFLNAGNSVDLLLAVGGCPMGPILAGSWGFFPTAAGNYCLVASPGESERLTVDCDTVNPLTHPSTAIGFGVDGDPSCIDNLCASAVEPTTWGAIKSLYR